MPTNRLKSVVFIVVFVVLVVVGDGLGKTVKTKFKRKVAHFGEVVTRNDLPHKDIVYNSSRSEGGRGLFFAAGLLSLGKVLNFFPVGGERECQPTGHTIARAGICLNQYDCRQRDGRAAGDCAHGLGVCCVFEVSCGGLVQNNLTYFMSPEFPELWSGEKDCDITIEKTHAGITQLKIDFVHFTIGQPNRTTGECDEDAMILGEGDNKFVLCGQNHGQHIYYNLPSDTEIREAEDLPTAKSTRLSIRMRGGDTPRLWLLRLAQMPLAYSAPHDCLQYHTGDSGVIKTFNFASNGRHLAAQEYRACVRRSPGRCAVRYAPCDQRSFRIGPASGPPALNTIDQMQQEQLMPVDDVMQEEEGSGFNPDIAPVVSQPVAPPSLASRIWSFIWPSWLWGQRSARTFAWSRWSPYAQHYVPEDDNFRYYGYGNFGVGLRGYGRQRCTDRITIPCENEYFVSSTSYFTGVCDPHHCGGSFCVNGGPDCHVESSLTPFAVSVHFGPPVRKRSPEENIGACLRYTLLPCDE